MKRALIGLLVVGCGASREPLPPPASALSPVPTLPVPEAVASAPARPELPEIVSFALPSGLTVQIAERPGLPVVFVGLVGRGAFAQSNGAPAALDVLVERALGARLPRGLGDLSGDADLARARVSDRGLVLVSRVVPGEFVRVLARFTSTIEGDGLDDAQIERARAALREHTRFAQRQRSRRRYPTSSEELFKRLYGENDRRVARSIVRWRTVERLEPARVRQRLACFLRPSESRLVIVGDVDAAVAESAVREHLSAITIPSAACGRPERAAPPSFPDPEHRLMIHGTGDEPNATIRLVERGPPADHADYAAYRLYARLAGGMFSSRLNLLLRENRGDTYGVITRVVDRVDHSLLEITVMVPVAAAGYAAAAIVEELARLNDAPRIEASEMDVARTVELAGLAGALDTGTGIGVELVRAFLAGRPSESILENYARVEALTSADVASAATRWVRPEHAPMVIVGDYRWLFSHPVRVPGGVRFVNDL